MASVYILNFTVNLQLEYYSVMLSMWEFGMDGGRYDGKSPHTHCM
jgi:hypothetical protein